MAGNGGLGQKKGMVKAFWKVTLSERDMIWSRKN